jgi:serine/threonine protein kinase
MDIRKLGDYEIIRLLGRGGFGTVYKAKSADGTVVAIKVLNPKALEDKSIVNKFFHEAIIMARLDHPYITKLLDFFLDEDNYAIVMEYIEGTELDKVLSELEKGLPFDTAFQLARQILDAFQYALEHGILHRDIKPANIMIDADGDCKIMDFGVAKMVSAASHGTATFILSLRYIPPERFDPGREIDARSDIYSLGCVFYEMFAGRMVFEISDMEASMHHHLNILPDPPADHAPDLPDEINQAILKSLEKNPADRFNDFLEFKEAIEQVEVRKQAVPTESMDLSLDSIPKKADVLDITDTVNRRFGQYVITRPIGVGKYGSVWRATSKDENDYALKVLKLKDTVDQDVIEACLSFADFIAEMDHPHIAKAFGFFQEGNHFAVAMEYVEGIPLKKILPRQSDLLPVDLSYKLANQMLDAFQHAYDCGILHLDIKPRKIMIDRAGDCKIMDFSVIKLISLLFQEPIGRRISLHYSPPDKYDANWVPDVRSDIYSLGLVFYEMFAGRRAFVTSNNEQLMHCHLNVLPEAPSLYVKDLPREISQAISKSLEKDPADRFQDFREFKDAMQCVLPLPPVRTKMADWVGTCISHNKGFSDRPEFVGQELGGYDVIHPIGVGRIGSVWKAISKDGKELALKVLNPKGFINDRMIEGFLHETEALNRLNHPNINAFIDFFHHGNSFVIAMEYVEGIELKKLLPRQKDLLPFHLSLKLAGQMLDALQHAQSRNIAHTDVKPRNIMVDQNGDCKIMDLGMTNLFDTCCGDTSVKRLSLHYASPETYDPACQKDIRSAIYSVGLIFYEMFTGRRAFMVNDTNRIIHCHLNVIPEPPSTYKEDLPPEICQAISKSLEKAPDDRFENFAAFKEALGLVDPEVTQIF